MTKAKLLKEWDTIIDILFCDVDPSRLSDDGQRVHAMVREYVEERIDSHLGCKNWPNCDEAGCGYL